MSARMCKQQNKRF